MGSAAEPVRLPCGCRRHGEGVQQEDPSRSAAYYLGNNVAYLVSRPEGLDAGNGTGPSFSTLMQWTYKDFTVESLNDLNNRRYLISLTQNIGFNVVAPAAGFLVTNCLS